MYSGVSAADITSIIDEHLLGQAAEGRCTPALPVGLVRGVIDWSSPPAVARHEPLHHNGPGDHRSWLSREDVALPCDDRDGPVGTCSEAEVGTRRRRGDDTRDVVLRLNDESRRRFGGRSDGFRRCGRGWVASLLLCRRLTGTGDDEHADDQVEQRPSGHESGPRSGGSSMR